MLTYYDFPIRCVCHICYLGGVVVYQITRFSFPIVINGPAVVEYDVLLTQLQTQSDLLSPDADGGSAGRSRALFVPIVLINYLSAREPSCDCNHTM